MGFHILAGETKDFLEHLAGLSKSANPPTTNRKRLTGEIPRSSEAAQRPIRNFFLGAEPEWSDAYSTQVVRRRVNSTVLNSIYNGRHVALVGLPLSGKSTILKQVATELRDHRTTLYFDRISEPLAAQIVADHDPNAGQTIIFVDRLIDSRDAIDRIVNTTRSQIVCAEDSMYFDSVSLRSIGTKLDVISCSEIGQQDLQSIIESIPVDVRRWNPDTYDDIENDAGDFGLFESFRKHVFDESLTDRFRVKLAEFEQKDREAFDVYIMACYVAACRTIVSFDMIFMFLDHPKKDYGDVYDVVSRIGSFLTEVDLAEDNSQDHFSVRSGALARVALKECQSKSFGRVYDRFNAAVPTRVVVDYPVFRRYAYDNDFARRAYPSG